MKTQKGITLIALIITIIVMLILVGVSVSVALNTGLFSTAQEAAKDTKAHKENETKLSTGKITVIEDGVEKEKNILDYATLPGTENPGDDESAGHILRFTRGGETFDYPITETTTFENLITAYPDDFSTKYASGPNVTMLKWKGLSLVYYSGEEAGMTLWTPLSLNELVFTGTWRSGKIVNADVYWTMSENSFNSVNDQWVVLVNGLLP